MFKKDQLVTLVEASSLSSVSVGKTYKVAEDQVGDGRWLEIINDAGETEGCGAYRFEAAAAVPFTEAPIGTTVFCMMHGEGVIYTTTLDAGAYKVGVKFTNGITSSYTREGKNQAYNPVPMLYYARPEIKAPEAPVFVSKLIGKEVLVTYKYNGSYFKVGKVTGETLHSFVIDGIPLAKDNYYFNEIGDKL